MTEGSAQAAKPFQLFRRKERPVTPAEVMRPRAFLILSALILMLIGLVMIYSASSVSALSDPDIGDAAYYLKKQFVFILLGVVLCALTAKIPYQRWMGIAGWIPWATVVLVLIVTAAMGVVGLGAQRWITVPGLGTFQPSEFAKIAIIISMASLVQRFADGDIDTKRFIIMSAVVIFVPCGLIIAQPDLGTTIIAVAAALLVLWFGEVRLKPIILAICGVAVVAVVFVITSPYRMQRVQTLFNPLADPLGDGYQVLNSLYAFGSGGFFGVGLGNSAQKYNYLPEAHTDFIFSIIGEEGGFFGCLAVIALFVVFVICGIRIAHMAPSLSGRAIAGASSVVIGIQALINMACTLGIFPVTGKPLPFVSSGGSSLFATMILVGLILSVSFATGKDTAYERRMNFRVIDGGTGASRRDPWKEGVVHRADDEKRSRSGSRSSAARADEGAKYKKASEDRENVRSVIGSIFGRSKQDDDIPDRQGEDRRSASSSRDDGRGRDRDRKSTSTSEARRRSDSSQNAGRGGTIQLADMHDRSTSRRGKGRD